MKITLLPAARRGLVQNPEFRGYPLFSSGQPDSTLFQA